MWRVTSIYCGRGARAMPTPRELSAMGKSFTYSQGLVQQTQVAAIGRVQQYSADPNKRPSFLGNLLDNLKQEYTKSKDMQDSLKKFREEAKRLEESDALKDARRKFQNIEGETAKGSSAFKDQLSGLADKVKDTEALKKAEEALKKASEIGGKLGESTEGARKTIGSAAESISKSGAFQTVSGTAHNLKKEIESHSLGGRVYKPPGLLRKRNEYEFGADEAKPVAPNEEALGMELHKDSKFYASWNAFKDNNPVVNKFVDYRVKYEESDNPVVRSARILTDKVQDIMGGIFTRTELSEVLTEIAKMDPDFEKEQFLKDCETDFIPNILEAMMRGDLDILQDWCFEAPFNILATPIRECRKRGYVMDSKVLDIDNLDLAMGKKMEQGPVLVITFQSQQIMCVRDGVGAIVEGSDDKQDRCISTGGDKSMVGAGVGTSTGEDTFMAGTRAELPRGEMNPCWTLQSSRGQFHRKCGIQWKQGDY